MSWLEPSLKLPVAFNCTLPPEQTEGFGGVSVIPVKVAAVTVRVADAEILPEVAVAMQVPVLTAVAIALALTEHTEDALEDQTTELVTS